MPRLLASLFLSSTIIALAFSASGSNLFVESFAQSTVVDYNGTTITLEEQHKFCTSNTLQITGVSITDPNGNTIRKTEQSSQVIVEASVTSYCQYSNYPVLIMLEVINSDGVTSYRAFQNITMSHGDDVKPSFSWMVDDAGDYQLRIFAHACIPCSGDFQNASAFDLAVSD